MTSQQASERVVNGIKTRVLHGKDYVEVAERVNQVQHDKEAQGFSMVKQERYEWDGRYFLSITIEVKGKPYIGDAEVTFTAPKNTPAGSNPVETAQTSALGRALAFAGYGTVESIASFDEIARNQPGVLVITPAQSHTVEGSVSVREEKPLRNGDGSPAFPEKKSLEEVKELFLTFFKPTQWRGFKSAEIGAVDDEGLSDGELAKLWARLTVIDQDAKARAGATVAGAN